MNEQEALARMVPPSNRRPGKKQMFDGIIQIMITRACDKSCFGCTQGSNFGGRPVVMSVEQFEQACLSLKDYWGVTGVFGGNPAQHPKFEQICEVMRRHIPAERRGLWCNHPRGKGRIMAETFNPRVSNLNVHMDQEAWDEFKRDWPASMPFGLKDDSRHSPVFVSMRDLGVPEEKRWELISGCDINQHWSALIGVFRGELRAWFCEIAGAQSMLHQHDPNYPDTGVPLWIKDEDQLIPWWQLPMAAYAEQVRTHCHDCGVPLRGYGEMALSTSPDAREQVSAVHAAIAKPKVPGRPVETVTDVVQLGDRLRSTIDYIGNGRHAKK